MHESLTEREWEVARLVADGHTNGEIAKRLVIEESTVESHVHSILKKRALKNRVLLAQWYRDHAGERGAQRRCPSLLPQTAHRRRKIHGIMDDSAGFSIPNFPRLSCYGDWSMRASDFIPDGARDAMRRRLLIGVVVYVVALSAFLATPKDEASAYSYYTGGYYLCESDGNNCGYSSQTVTYGDWSCGYPTCSVLIYTLNQYINIWYQSEAFSCWYQELYMDGPQVVSRSDYATINYDTTPMNIYQTWNTYSMNFQSDAGQMTSIGDESGECWAYGSGGGLYFITEIVHQSSQAYTWDYGW